MDRLRAIFERRTSGNSRGSSRARSGSVASGSGPGLGGGQSSGGMVEVAGNDPLDPGDERLVQLRRGTTNPMKGVSGTLTDGLDRSDVALSIGNTEPSVSIDEPPRGFKSMLTSFENSAREELKSKKESQLRRAHIPNGAKQLMTSDHGGSSSPMDLAAVDDSNISAGMQGANCEPEKTLTSDYISQPRNEETLRAFGFVEGYGSMREQQDLGYVKIPPGTSPAGIEVALEQDMVLRLGAKVTHSSMAGSDTLVTADTNGRIIVWSLRQRQMICMFYPESGAELSLMKVLDESSDDCLSVISLGKLSKNIKTWLVTAGSAILTRSIEVPENEGDLMVCIPVAKPRPPSQQLSAAKVSDVNVEVDTDVQVVKTFEEWRGHDDGARKSHEMTAVETLETHADHGGVTTRELLQLQEVDLETKDDYVLLKQQDLVRDIVVESEEGGFSREEHRIERTTEVKGTIDGTPLTIETETKESNSVMIVPLGQEMKPGLEAKETTLLNEGQGMNVISGVEGEDSVDGDQVDIREGGEYEDIDYDEDEDDEGQDETSGDEGREALHDEEDDGDDDDLEDYEDSDYDDEQDNQEDIGHQVGEQDFEDEENDGESEDEEDEEGEEEEEEEEDDDDDDEEDEDDDEEEDGDEDYGDVDDDQDGGDEDGGHEEYDDDFINGEVDDE
uniref:Uncharacterized protein n=1 Tax=Compsopogon caeruleus TaxID=31354 RepID=A0A7S1T9P6_9RHOD|mmetsp:Transcript_13773/g.28267  ORF Transcript_13773/g.28267 Transcript_13773/m.28267 type:complete len:673 (+) Transcript_13773:91-2109(+)